MIAKQISHTAKVGGEGEREGRERGERGEREGRERGERGEREGRERGERGGEGRRVVWESCFWSW